MAVLENFTPTSGKLPEFDDLALGTRNATGSIIEEHLQYANPPEALGFARAHAVYTEAFNAKIEHVLRNGSSNSQIEARLDVAYKEYAALRRKHQDNPSLSFLSDPIHRKQFEIGPYPITDKHLPPFPYPGASAAQDGLWPGYDKPEYFDQFRFLKAYETLTPGKALQAFLRKHRLYFHFPETISRYGVLFVPPPYLDDDSNVELRQHLNTCDTLFHTAPTVMLKDSVAEARLVLSYCEDDMPAVVEDEGGQCVGIVDWRMLEGRSDHESVSAVFSKGWNEAPSQDMTAEEAFSFMEKNNWSYMLRFSEYGPRVVTQTTAALSHFLPPHTFNEGLGSALYFGISDVREGDKLIERIEKEAGGVPAALVETAHADTEYFRTVLRHYRKRLQDVFMMAGTTIDPAAALDFLMEYGADGVKLGIARSRACRTSWTGVALPNAYVGLICGAAMQGKGYGMLDGWGTPDEFIKGLAMSGIQMRQAGGAFMGRREAANPTIMRNNVSGKLYRGMAGADVQEAVLGKKDPSPLKRMEAKAHLHSEGTEIFVPKRTPSTVGRMLLAYKLLLQSSMSYAGVRAELADPPLLQFHRSARLYAVESMPS